MCRAVEEICFNTAKMLHVDVRLHSWNYGFVGVLLTFSKKTNSSLHVGVMESSDDFGVCL